MADIKTPEERSRNMAAIRSKNTKPEIIIRKALHALGFRYRLHGKNIPGKPDIVLTKYNAVIFIHGCFWHGHDCYLFKLPKTRTEFWKEKIELNRVRDKKVMYELEQLGWRIAIVWECALKGRDKMDIHQLIGSLAEWLNTDSKLIVLRGSSNES